MKNWKLPAAVGALGLIAAITFALNYPAVENLGSKVRLPVFHGALTWANLMVFAALGLVALVYLIKGNEKAYRWTEALRFISVIMWIVGTVLGFLAAMNTWDFTGSQTPMLTLLMSDPRLVIQIVVALFGLALFVLPLIVESHKVRAAVDFIFVLVMAVGLGWAMNAGKALHPDSPVMNSDEFIIKALFFCMVISNLVMAAGFSSAIVAYRTNSLAKRSAKKEVVK